MSFACPDVVVVCVCRSRASHWSPVVHHLAVQSWGLHWSTYFQRLDQHVRWLLFFSSLPRTIPLDPPDPVDRGPV